MGALGAKCFHTFSDEQRSIPADEWDDERFGMVCGKADAFADMKSALLRLCKISGRCTYEDVQTIRQFGAKLSRFNFAVGRR